MAPQLFCGIAPEVMPSTPRTARGKWDFSSDEKLLEAHQVRGNFDVYDKGWNEGHRLGFKAGIASKNDWSTSIAGAIIMSVLLICATAIAIMQPEYFTDAKPIGFHLGAIAPTSPQGASTVLHACWLDPEIDAARCPPPWEIGKISRGIPLNSTQTWDSAWRWDGKTFVYDPAASAEICEGMVNQEMRNRCFRAVKFKESNP